MQFLLQPMLAGFSILQLALIVLGVVAALAAAAAAGFYIARRTHTTDTTARMGPNPSELVRQKRRSSDGSSTSTLMRRERDRARRHVQRTVRLRQSSQAKTEGRPARKQYAPVNILRPIALGAQADVGSVWEADGTINKLKESARGLLGGLSQSSSTPAANGLDELVLDAAAAGSAEVARFEAAIQDDMAPAPVEAPVVRPVARTAPLIMRPEPVAARVVTAAAPRDVPRDGIATSPHDARLASVTARLDTPAAPVAAAPVPQLQPEPALTAPMPTPLPTPALAVMRAAVQAPAAARAEPAADATQPAAAGGRASSADLKRRLAQVRERNSTQRAQMAAAAEPMRKTS